MVANFATVKLASFGNRIASSRQLNRTLGMEDAVFASRVEPSAGQTTRANPRRLVRRAGRQDENPLGLPSREKYFLLTSPFIGLGDYWRVITELVFKLCARFRAGSNSTAPRKTGVVRADG